MEADKLDVQMDQLCTELLKRENLHSVLRLLDSFHIYGEKKGFVTRSEFRKMCTDLKISIDRTLLEALMTWCDPTGEGIVSQAELSKYLSQVQAWGRDLQQGGPKTATPNSARPPTVRPSDQSWTWFREPTQAELESQRGTPATLTSAAKKSLVAPWANNDESVQGDEAKAEMHTGRRLHPNAPGARKGDNEPPWGIERPSQTPVSNPTSQRGAPMSAPSPNRQPSAGPSHPNEAAIMHDLSRQLNDDIYGSFCNLKKGLGHIDRNRNGRVDRNEMRRMCNQYNLRLRGNLLEQLFDLAESNGSISCADFVRIFESVNRTEPVKLPRVEPDRRGLLFG
eukprot:Opistho-2@18926